MKKVITVKNGLAQIEPLLDEVEQLLASYNFSDEHIYQIKLCLDELLTNIINYGFQDDDEHEIVIHFEIHNSEISIQIVDDGIEFNPLDTPEPDLDSDLEEREIGGLGVFLVKNYMDELRYKRIEDKNQLILTKRILKHNGV